MQCNKEETRVYTWIPPTMGKSRVIFEIMETELASHFTLESQLLTLLAQMTETHRAIVI